MSAPTASAPTTPQKESGLARFMRSPTRGFTLKTPPRPASPTTTGADGRPTPSRSNTRDSSNGSTAKSRTSILTSPFITRKSGLAPSSTAASSEAVNEAPKSDEPVATSEPAAETKPVAETKPAEESGHVRARSGSTISTRSSQVGPLTPPPPTQAAEPISMAAKADADPVSDTPREGGSVSSRSPSRLRRQVSNLSRHSLSGSIRRLSLLGPGAASPPQVETAPAIGELEKRSRSPSVSSARRVAAASDPVAEPASTSESAALTSEPAAVTSEPAAITSEPAAFTSEPVASEPVAAESPAPAPQVEAPQVEAPQVEATQVEAPQVEAAQVEAAQVEAPQPAAQAPAEVAAKVPTETTTEAPTETPQQEAPKAVELETPSKVKPSTSRNASTTSLTQTPEKPKPRRRDTLTNWARRSIDRKASGSGPALRPPSRGPLSGDESDADSVKERERGWNTGRPVPEPKKSEDNLKSRFKLGRRSSTGHAKTPSESPSETEKKSNWATKVLRVGSKSKKDKSEGGSLAGTSTADVSTVDVVPEPVIIPDSRPSLAIPDNLAMDQRPLSAIVESPIVPLNSQAAWGDVQSAGIAAVMSSPLANTAVVADSPTEAKPEEVTSEPEIIEAPTKIATPVPASPELHEVTVLPVEPVAAVEPAPPTEEVQPEVTQEAESKDTTAAVETPAVASGTTTPARVETNGIAAPPPNNLLSPISPNSPSSTPWDPTAQREIARARSPRRSTGGGPSNRSRGPSPAASIIGVKRKLADEPDVAKGRVRYLPDWAVSPAIQLAVTLSLVLPRRRRDAAGQAGRRRGWWPFKRSGPRTELRYNAIRGVNEEVPIVSRSWTVPAAMRTTAKVLTAPARFMFRMFIPRSTPTAVAN